MRGLPALLGLRATGTRPTLAVGLLSVLIFPLLALGLLRGDKPGPAAVPATQPVTEPHLM